jgi:hypothetical protein
VSQQIPGRELRPVHVAKEKVLQRWGTAAIRIAKPNWAFGIGGNIVRALQDQDLTAELEGVVPAQVRDAVRKLPNAIRAYGLRPT